MGALEYQHTVLLITIVAIMLGPIKLAALNNVTEQTPSSYQGVLEEPSGHVTPVIEYRPIQEVEYRVFSAPGGRRRLAPFQLCLACRCCSAGSTYPSLCATLPCCFGIDCSLPDKPYGVCAFVPKSCNCTTCGM